MAAQIEAPLEAFLELDGTPLENGYIYIGESGKNAEANPITVYWDDAYSIAAAQPIRTIGGYGSNNGIRANVYVSGYYSIVIKDKNGALIFSGDSIVDPAIAVGVTEAEAQVQLAKEEAWRSEAEALTSESYATQTEDVFVDEYTSDGDGTFTATPTTDYSSLHWAAKSEATGDYLPLAGGTMTGQIKGITPVSPEDLTRKDYVDSLVSAITSGTYTPTASDLINLDSIIVYEARYTRIGNIVTVSGSLLVDLTATGQSWFNLSLPIAATFSSSFEASGVLTGAGTGSQGFMKADATTNNMYAGITASTTAGHSAQYTFTYEI